MVGTHLSMESGFQFKEVGWMKHDSPRLSDLELLKQQSLFLDHALTALWLRHVVFPHSLYVH